MQRDGDFGVHTGGGALMSLGAVAMNLFNQHLDPAADAALINFGRSAAGAGLLAGARMPPALADNATSHLLLLPPRC